MYKCLELENKRSKNNFLICRLVYGYHILLMFNIRLGIKSRIGVFYLECYYIRDKKPPVTFETKNE